MLVIVVVTQPYEFVSKKTVNFAAWKFKNQKDVGNSFTQGLALLTGAQ